MNDYAPVNGDQDLNYSHDKMNNELGEQYSVNEHYYVGVALRQWKCCPSKVANEFFSVSNIKRIQKRIKKIIYDKSFKKFRLSEDQKVLDLLICMIEIYNTYAKDLDFNVIKQVKMLNAQVVEYVYPGMMDNIKQHYGYLEDIRNPVNQLPDPINVNNAGRRAIYGSAQAY